MCLFLFWRTFLQPAFIHVDLDGFWSHLGYYGISQSIWPDPVYSDALPRWLEIFREFGVKATFFIIGQDIKVKEKAILAEAICAEGHEIANHSFSHDVPMSLLSKKEKYDEVMKSHEELIRVSGIPPVGFRAPSFSLDEDLLDILEDEGYLYDSSLFSSPFGSLVQGALNYIGNKQHKDKNHKKNGTYGNLKCVFAPTTPYMPRKNCCWKKGDRKIWETPVSFFPLLKLPFHFSYILALQERSIFASRLYYNSAITYTSILNRPLLYLFHGLELVDPNLIKKIKFQPGTSIPLKQKIHGVKSILESIQSMFNIICLKDYLKKKL